MSVKFDSRTQRSNTFLASETETNFTDCIISFLREKKPNECWMKTSKLHKRVKKYVIEFVSHKRTCLPAISKFGFLHWATGTDKIASTMTYRKIHCAAFLDRKSGGKTLSYYVLVKWWKFNNHFPMLLVFMFYTPPEATTFFVIKGH